jgi:hypothetical protein
VCRARSAAAASCAGAPHAVSGAASTGEATCAAGVATSRTHCSEHTARAAAPTHIAVQSTGAVQGGSAVPQPVPLALALAVAVATAAVSVAGETTAPSQL